MDGTGEIGWNRTSWKIRSYHLANSSCNGRKCTQNITISVTSNTSSPMAQWKGMNSRQQLPTNSLGSDATAQIYLSPTLMLFWVVLSCCFNSSRLSQLSFSICTGRPWPKSMAFTAFGPRWSSPYLDTFGPVASTSGAAHPQFSWGKLGNDESHIPEILGTFERRPFFEKPTSSRKSSGGFPEIEDSPS